ncbi:MAG: Crp/Fnr family transcriptional regulator [Desulfobacteraceae bacterium]|nr:Crp/Fnr family transcriptional regulator [Desulfobacteraceae bacterium]MCB9494857.1 Crp/Fnr family transcriptional regulator [Desulfobacteraceae bacterium]
MEKTFKNTLMFKSFTDEQIKELIKISSIKTYDNNQMIFFENDPACGFFLIKKGKVKIFKMSEDGKEQILHIFGKGEPFGEAAVFSNTDFPANAQAVVKSEIIYIPKTDLHEIFRKDPSTVMNILAVLSLRLKEFTKLIENLTLKELPERLALYILNQEKTQGKKNRIVLEFSKGQLAKILGTTQETLSRTLGRLSKAGIILVDKREIIILNKNLLHNISSGVENLKNIDI